MGAQKLENCTVEYGEKTYEAGTVWYDGQLSKVGSVDVLTAGSGIIVMDKQGIILFNESSTRGPISIRRSN